MYCRKPYTDDHLNPFSKNACCLFKIGSKRGNQDDSRNIERATSDAQVGPRLFLLLLLVWIVFGILIALVMAPYITALKMTQTAPDVLEQLRMPFSYRQ